jgi:hypothetical protein
MALTLYEDRIDPSHGQRKDLALDPDLAEEWTGLTPVKDFAAEAMARLADTKKDDEHAHTFRYVVGLREGWEERKAAKVCARLDEALRSQSAISEG